MNTTNSHVPVSSSHLSRELQDAQDQFLTHFKIREKSSSDRAHGIFSGYSFDHKNLICQSAITNFTALKEVKSSAEPLEIDITEEREDELKCLDIIHRRLGLIFDKSIINHYEKGNIIEIYDSQGIQVYRNLNFFRMTNYSLLDVITHPLDELWERSSGVLRQITEMTWTLAQLKDLRPIKCPVDEHYLIEKAYGNTQVLKVRPKMCAKVQLNLKENFGFMTLIDAEVISQGAESNIRFI